MNLDAPNELQLDALREVANVGCGHAANALSQLVGGRAVRLDVPQVLVSRAAEMPTMLGGEDVRRVAVVLEMQGDLSGHLVLALPERDAQDLCAMMLNQPCDGLLTELQRSAISEAANIVASACLTAIGKLTGLKLLPSAPVFAQEDAPLAVEATVNRSDNPTGLVVVLEARFHTATPAVEGQLLMLPDRKSLAKLLSKLGV